ncbi:MAG: FliH/SctL family protein [Acidimicrobiia bacterium]|nr:FliH/SctL family protein [Acidimicrobiia bacterium]
MNRVIRNASLAAAPQAFGPGAPVLIDDYMSQMIEQAQAEAFEAGRREGFAAGRAETAEAGNRIETALVNAAADLVRMRTECVRGAVDAGLEVAEFVLGRAPHDGGETLAPRIAAALNDLDDEELVVAIHPQDWDTISTAVRLPNGVTMEPDPALRPGEARISGRWASAELTREAALSVVREVLS